MQGLRLGQQSIRPRLGESHRLGEPHRYGTEDLAGTNAEIDAEIAAEIAADPKPDFWQAASPRPIQMTRRKLRR